MGFRIELTSTALAELKILRAFDRRAIVGEIRKHLAPQPTVTTRNRKCLEGLIPAFEHVLPVWELRVGDYRVFYDVDGKAEVVYVRAVRRKLQGQTTSSVKETTLEQFALNLQQYMDASQLERVLIMRGGKPVAVVLGLEHKDEEDLMLETSPEFWRMIEERRKQPTVRLEDVEAELLADDE